MNRSPLIIAGVEFSSRLFVGTGKFSSGDIMRRSLEASGTQLVTVALGRVRTGGEADDILGHLDPARYRLLPNTSGTRTAREAVLAAELAREALETNWLKLEIHPDPKYLMPDPIETLEATELLVKRGFIVLPYVHADPVLCKRLEEAGAAAVMPLGSPIGSNLGLESRAFLEIIVAQSRIPVVVDAGLGAPSHAAAALEMGADAVLVNTAIAAAEDPVAMAAAFRLGVEAGRAAREAGLPGPDAAREAAHASATSPLTSFLGEAVQ
jgi:thiazole synthase